MPSRSDIARQLVDVCRRLYARGFVTATDGNVSARLTGGTILTTPTGVNKGQVTEADLVEVTADGTVLAGSRQPSTELGMHLFIYRQRPDAGAVVHAHPPYATGFAVARQALATPVLPEVIVGLGEIPLAPYATPSTPAMADSLAPFVKHATAILLANHGVVTFGADLEEAYFKTEKTEHAAQIVFVARMLGGEQSLTSRDIEHLRSLVEARFANRSDAPLSPLKPSSQKA